MGFRVQGSGFWGVAVQGLGCGVYVEVRNLVVLSREHGKIWYTGLGFIGFGITFPSSLPSTSEELEGVEIGLEQFEVLGACLGFCINGLRFHV